MFDDEEIQALVNEFDPSGEAKNVDLKLLLQDYLDQKETDTLYF